ncbi:MAG: phage tail protein [Salibacteraceae bacterium]|jgi:phage tail-like protein|nr:phage tail protein [Salibacteraceae bacterium]MDP4686060.1 phage tail protein [Salibacteraceae bacterium]MDP4764683.1 phage tail protein [Salibacteraceae bacterium]MDP4843986.1 phage tail protein [Salibacteraceae bacterium]MDP4935483.1 phage tail protein [Salibacteraceae bacterium]
MIDPRTAFFKGAIQDSNWPLPSFHFMVLIGNEKWSFQEVGNLTASTETLTYRHGKSGQGGSYKVPGIQTFEPVVLKRGMFSGNTSIFEWYEKSTRPDFERKDVVISLLDQHGMIEMIWSLTNVYPSKIEGGNFNAKGTGDSASSMESVTLIFEDMTLDNYLSYTMKKMSGLF